MPCLGATGTAAGVEEASRPREEYRTYELVQGDATSERVYNHYREQHEKMTLDYVRRKKAEYGCLDGLGSYQPKAEWTIPEIIQRLDFFDPSDPDFEDNNLFHCYQTAERARARYPEERWLHFAALVHDLGKILFIWGEPAWAVCGDTYPVGCRFQREKIVFPETFDGNPDEMDAVLSSPLGIYQPGCGLMNLHMAWGHDELFYWALKRADEEHHLQLDPRIPYIVRFHSFYPWHSGGAYMEFEDDLDRQMLPWIKKFQELDLYSKDGAESALPDIEKLNKEYYDQLIGEFSHNVKLKL
ncbi:unnamed protein product [Vitrella brassicaformis CCMP3155]|uniref:Inositol oxygenase n=2 Tax=Vitrella brassicaformis TaxID=1169539 RepID=A0A0G4FCT6_VITBC|nr:unnamed protein product [Vitrella brassicaformis CCMP3155]|mmetsp:Transcript_15717/g.37507  ORF Transcript_15717/g.37507 Transcript_15717/m.37507 type:complete len:299 (+) Transcript_15717:91-987(+)|eukprot:CEM10727.1 unnamed protein product [Vitrella brassicaformis CCMP3155]